MHDRADTGTGEGMFGGRPRDSTQERAVLKGIFLAAIVAAGAASTGALAREDRPSLGATQATDDPTLLETVVVTGRVTGPGLWQVYKDDEHDLWIMGTLSPLPAGIEWDSTAVRGLVSGADEVLWAPGYAVDVEANLLQQAMLGIGYLRAKKNPDGKSLREVLPPALYARWLEAKSRYMPRNSRVERKRPLVAAEELLAAATDKAGLSYEPIVYPALESTLEEGGVRSNYPKFEVEITSDAAKAALSDIRRISLDDAKCLEATLDAVERDVPRMVANANAWTRGDVGRISFESLAKRNSLCSDALMDADFSAKYGLPNIRESIAALWLKEAESALARNAVTVAFVPMEHLVGADNYLDALKARGYTVSSP
jgi:hypothetical protein